MYTVFQDYQTPLGEDWKDHESTLLGFKKILGDQNFILQADGKLRVAHYVGFLSKGATELQILPKILSGAPDAVQREESLRFLYRLLDWSDYMGFKALTERAGITEEPSLAEQFIRLFVDHFLHLHQRDVYRGYVAKEEELLYVRGKIQFPASLYTRWKRAGYLSNRFEEFSVDNIIHGIIKTTLLRLLFQSRRKGNKKKLKQAIGFLEEVTPLPLSEELFDRVPDNRTTAPYKPLVSFARLLFQRGLSGFHGGSQETLSMMIPLNLLFERAVLTLLQDVYKAAGYDVTYQKKRYWGKTQDHRNRFPLVPDFYASSGRKPVHILDTKFKNPFNKHGRVQIASSDLYQLNAYASAFACGSLFLLYPRFLDQEQRSGKDCCLETLALPSFHRTVTLKIIQIDIMKTDREGLIDDLNHAIF